MIKNIYGISTGTPYTSISRNQSISPSTRYRYFPSHPISASTAIINTPLYIKSTFTASPSSSKYILIISYPSPACKFYYPLIKIFIWQTNCNFYSYQHYILLFFIRIYSFNSFFLRYNNYPVSNYQYILIIQSNL